jgi:hypothetical protein
MTACLFRKFEPGCAFWRLSWQQLLERGESVMMKLIAVAAVLAAATPALAGPSSLKLQENQQVMTCTGTLSERHSDIFIACPDKDGPLLPGHISTDLIYLTGLPKTDKTWLTKVCGDPRKLEHICRVQVVATYSETRTETAIFDAVRLLHVTDKPRFSWEREVGCCSDAERR